MNRENADTAPQQHDVETLIESFDYRLPLILRVEVAENTSDLIIRSQAWPVPLHDEVTPQPFTFEPIYIPLIAFRDGAQRQAYIDAVRNRLSKTLAASTAQSAVHEVLVAVNMSFVDAGVRGNKKALADFILRSYTRTQRKMLKERISPRGGAKLRADVKREASELFSNGLEPKLITVADLLGRTEAALSKELKRKRVSWKAIKSEVKNRDKKLS